MVNFSRRQFLKQSAATGAMALAGGWLHGGATPAAARPIKGRPRIAAIGVGNRGGDVLSPLDPSDVVAVCDVDQRYLAAAQRRFAKAAAYHDYRELFTRDDVDAVVISTPDHSHTLPAMLAMRRGWHVYLEKPLAHNVREVQWLMQAARQSGVVTQMGNQHHSSRGYRRAAQLLNDGLLGRMERILAWTNRPHWQQGIPRPGDMPAVPEHLHWDLWLGAAPARPYHDLYHPFQWRGWRDFGTGTLGDMGTHLLDPIVLGLKLPLPHRIHAETGPRFDESFPAWSIVHFQFAWPTPEDVLPLTWYDGGKQPDAAITGASRLPDNGVLILGERGKMFLPELGQMPRVLPAELMREAAPEADADDTDHLQRWLDAMQQRAACNCDFAYGGHLTMICLLGNLSLHADEPLVLAKNAADPLSDPALTPQLGREYRDGWHPHNK